MNRHELVEAVAEKTGIPKAVVARVFEAMISCIADKLRFGGKVTMTGFGTFRVSVRKARSGVLPRDPSTRIHIPESRVPAFTAGKPFKDAIQQ